MTGRPTLAHGVCIAQVPAAQTIVNLLISSLFRRKYRGLIDWRRGVVLYDKAGEQLVGPRQYLSP